MQQTTLTRLCAGTCLFLVPLFVSAQEPVSAGREIYVKTCAACHGETGRGSEVHDKPLAGDLSIPQLAGVIQKTMPEDDPGSLSELQAKQVAEFVHGEFYSEVARKRHQPARIELARLTVRQYRLALADLIRGFRPSTNGKSEPGLKAEYYEGRRVGDRRKLAESRIDPQVEFDFGTKVPVKKINTPEEFSIRWQGSVSAPETGEYRFVVKTEHAMKLWVNDSKTPLIDAWVKSGNDTEYEADCFLVAGQSYSLKLDFTKAKQGVDDSKKRKGPPPSAPASIALCWQRPGGEVEPIAARDLSTQTAAEGFACDTPFPPDDRSYGWERGTTVSQAWNESTTNGAIQTARYVSANLDSLAGTKQGAGDREAKAKAFCQTFAERAFRRPLSKEQSAWLIDGQFQDAGNIETAVKRVVLLTLKSPRFLYREIGGPDQFDIASRLAFGLWDSLPDETLLSAAKNGELASDEQIRSQAERMLDDPRAKTKIHEFLLTYLHANTEREIDKDAQKFPEFDRTILADLKTSLELFLDDVAWSADADFRQLLLSEEVYLNPRLAKFYDVKPASETGFKPVKLNAGERAGILTHPYLMAIFADQAESSPIHRGVFLVRGVLGHSLRPPPIAVTPLPAKLHPKLTTRERVILQTNSSTCMTCHGMINPLGFSLEKFDAVGRYREKDREQPVDDQGSYHTRAGEEKSFDGARDLAEFLANSPETHDAFAEQFFHHLVQQSIGAYGSETREKLRKEFAANNFHIRKLAVTIMQESALTGRHTEIVKK